MASATASPLASLNLEAEPQQEQSSGQRNANVGMVRSQLRFLARLHKPCIGVL